MKTTETTADSVVILFDLDDFNAFNVKHGRAEGDCRLKQFRDVLSQIAAKFNGSALRVSGDEFILAISESLCDPRDAIEMVKSRWTCSPTFSVGWARGEGAIKRADAALLKAKRRGKNRVEEGVSIDLGAKARGVVAERDQREVDGLEAKVLAAAAKGENHIRIYIKEGVGPTGNHTVPCTLADWYVQKCEELKLGHYFEHTETYGGGCGKDWHLTIYWGNHSRDHAVSISFGLVVSAAVALGVAIIFLAGG